jgi:hypothetical protein
MNSGDALLDDCATPACCAFAIDDGTDTIAWRAKQNHSTIVQRGQRITRRNLQAGREDKLATTPPAIVRKRFVHNHKKQKQKTNKQT